MSPFRGCLSGSSELGWGSVELLRTSDGRVFFLIARFVLASASTWSFRYSMFGFFSGSPSGSRAGWEGGGGGGPPPPPLLSSRFCDVVLQTLPCSLVGGLHCTSPINARKIAMGECYTLWGRSGLPGLLGRRIVGGACHSYCHRL